jgi:hypothetical protein
LNFQPVPAKRKPRTAKRAKEDLSRIERAAKRKEQKEQGMFDGRFRPRVVKNRKRYDRKRKDDAKPDE